jgi:hypothetical protein
VCVRDRERQRPTQREKETEREREREREKTDWLRYNGSDRVPQSGSSR